MILDGTDNFETRFLINDVAVKYGIPWIYGACIATYGLGMVIRPGGKNPQNSPAAVGGGGGCLRCLFETIPPPGGGGPTCDTAGILGPTVQMVASWQANEALKILTGNLESISPYLFSFDSWENRFQQINLSKIRELADCPVCKHGQYDYLTGKNGSSTTTLCGRNAVQITPPIPPPHENGSVGTGSTKSRMDFARIAESLRNSGTVTYNAFMLKCVLTSDTIPPDSTAEAAPPMELTLFTDGRAIIKGTHDPGVARTIYARYIGS